MAAAGRCWPVAMGFMTARAGSNTRVAPRFKLPSPPPSLSAWPEDGDTRDEAEQRTADMLLAAAQELRVQFPMEQAQELWGLVDGAVEAIELFQPGDNARARAEAKLKAAVSAAMSAVASASTYMAHARRVADIDVPNEVATAVKKAKAEAAMTLATAVEEERESVLNQLDEVVQKAALAARREAEREAESFLNKRIAETERKAAATLSKTIEHERGWAMKRLQEAVSDKEEEKENEKKLELQHAHAEARKAIDKKEQEKQMILETVDGGFNTFRSDYEKLSLQMEELKEAIKEQEVEALEERERRMAEAHVFFESATEKAKMEALDAKESAVAAAIAETREADRIEHERALTEALEAAKAAADTALADALAASRAEAEEAAASAAEQASNQQIAALEQAAKEASDAQAVAVQESKDATLIEHAQALKDAEKEAHEVGRLEGMEAAKAIYANTSETTEGAMKNSVQIGVEMAVAGVRMQMGLAHAKVLEEQRALNEAALAEAAAELAATNVSWQERLDAEILARADEVESCHDLTRSWVDAHAALEAVRLETVAMLEKSRHELATIEVIDLFDIRMAEMRERLLDKYWRRKASEKKRKKEAKPVKSAVSDTEAKSHAEADNVGHDAESPREVSEHSHPLPSDDLDVEHATRQPRASRRSRGSKRKEEEEQLQIAQQEMEAARLRMQELLSALPSPSSTADQNVTTTAEPEAQADEPVDKKLQASRRRWGRSRG